MKAYQACYIAYRKLVPLSLGNAHMLVTSHYFHKVQMLTPASVKKLHSRQLDLFKQLSYIVDIASRLIQLQLIFGPVLIACPVLMTLNQHALAYTLVMRALRCAGPTFTKLGQWAASRPDLLPMDLCNVLAELHSLGLTHSMHWNQRVILDQLGCDLTTLFMSFDPVPIGSGSVAQVHKAVLWDGTAVAVKIAHPSIREWIERDLLVISFVAGILDIVLPGARWIGLPEQASLFTEMMRQQLDLRYEAYTLHRFSRNFRWFKRSIGFPTVYHATPDVLIESLQTGWPVGKLAKLMSSDPHTTYIKRQVAHLGLSAFLQMLLWDNFVHADLHPGNIFIDLPPKSTPESSHDIEEALANSTHPRVCFIDTGLVTELHPRDFDNFTDLFIAMVIHGDGKLAARLIMDRSPGDHSQIRDPEGYVSQMASLIEPFFASGRLLYISELPITPLLLRVFSLSRAHHVRLDPHFTNLVMSLVCVEGLGRQLCGKELNVMPALVQAGVQYLATQVARKVSQKVQPYI